MLGPSLTCRTALCWGLGESSLSTSSLGAGRMLESQVLAVITFSLEELLAWPLLPGAEFSLSLWSSPPFVIYTHSVSPGGAPVLAQQKIGSRKS